MEQNKYKIMHIGEIMKLWNVYDCTEEVNADPKYRLTVEN